jgi:hypothetical protein
MKDAIAYSRVALGNRVRAGWDFRQRNPQGLRDPLGQNSGRELPFSRSAAAQCVKQREKFIKHAIPSCGERCAWIKRMKSDAALIAFGVRPYWRQLIRLCHQGNKRWSGVCSRSSTRWRSQGCGKRVLGSVKNKLPECRPNYKRSIVLDVEETRGFRSPNTGMHFGC